MLNIKNSFFLLLLVYSSSTMALAPLAAFFALASYFGIGGAGGACASTIVVSGTAATAATAASATITVTSAPAAATGVAAWWAGLSVAGKAVVGAAACAASTGACVGVYKVHAIIRAHFTEKELKTLNALKPTQNRTELQCQQEIKKYNLECEQNAEKRAAETIEIGKKLLNYCTLTGFDINALEIPAEIKALRDQYSIHQLVATEKPVRIQARA